VLSSGTLAANAGCATQSAQPLLSPGGAWSAIVQDTNCESGYSFTGAAVYTVEIVSQSNKANHANVFATEDDGHSNTRPVLTWLGANSLQITTLSHHGIGIQKPAFSTMKVSYKYLR